MEPSQKVLPYVYMLTHKETGEFYIGYREANKVPSNEDLPLYKSSSRTIKPNFNNFDWVILAEFYDGLEAYKFENSLIKFHFNDPLCLNGFYVDETKKHFRCTVFSPHSDETKKKISKGVKAARALKSTRGYRFHTLESRKAQSKRQTGKIRGPYGSWKIISPLQEVFLIDDLRKFAVEKSLSYDTLRLSSKRKPTSKGSCVGWVAIKL